MARPLIFRCLFVLNLFQIFRLLWRLHVTHIDLVNLGKILKEVLDRALLYLLTFHRLRDKDTSVNSSSVEAMTMRSLVTINEVSRHVLHLRAATRLIDLTLDLFIPDFATLHFIY